MLVRREGEEGGKILECDGVKHFSARCVGKHFLVI